MSLRRSLHDRVFRGLMRLLPAEFRADYGRELELHFRAERQAADGAAAMMRLWAATLGDVIRTAPAEHVDILSRDLAYAVRMLARRPALALATVLTLALGIGANTAIFSVVNGVLLAPLPYPGADRIVTIQEDPADRDPGQDRLLLIRCVAVAPAIVRACRRAGRLERGVARRRAGHRARQWRPRHGGVLPHARRHAGAGT